MTVNAWQKPDKGGKGKEAPVVSPLAEKIFFAYENHTSESASLIGYAFLDGTWAYHGIPAGGLPTCTEVTGSADKEGCVKYSYDPKTGAVQIGSLGGGKVLADGSLEIDGETYSPASIPAAGARLQVEQEYGGYTGLCGFISGCTTWFEHLLLTSGGEFVLTRSSLTTIGGSGPGETFIAAGSYPSDQHGTYAIEPRGRIRLSYADGSVKTRTIAIIPQRGRQAGPGERRPAARLRLLQLPAGRLNGWFSCGACACGAGRRSVRRRSAGRPLTRHPVRSPAPRPRSSRPRAARAR
jgi:hypothetical protein